MLENHFGREIVCECQVLNDEREIRKKALRRQFGVDFESGEVELVDYPVLQNRFYQNIRS